jgi:Metal-dependent hydrolase
METIERSGAEIICLQETETARISFGNVDLVRFLAEGLDMYSYYGPKTVTGTYGIALLSKFPIESAETTFMPSKYSQRAIIKSEIRVGTEIITVYNTHFGLALSDRALQAKLTADLAANSSRALLAGDFNTPDPAETPYVTISSKFRDGWLEINSFGTDILGATFDWKNPTERIDYIFFTPDLNIIDFRILDWAHESDHMPIVAVFEL